MKKVTIQLLIILLLPAAAGAQALKTGLFVGTRLPFHTESEGAAYRCSGNSNMDISYQLKYGYRLHVQGGLLYMSSNRRVTPLATDSFADVRLGYVGIPLQAGYSFVDRKDLQLRVLGGGCYRIPVMVSPNDLELARHDFSTHNAEIFGGLGCIYGKLALDVLAVQTFTPTLKNTGKDGFTCWLRAGLFF